MKLKFSLSLIVLLNILTHYSCDSVIVKGYCGDPGTPERSKVTPTKDNYTEEETVVYTCDDFISIKQYRKCVKGKWVGEVARCGNAFRDNDLKMAKIYDKSKGNLIEVYDTSALSEWTKFGNSFIAERYNRSLRAFGAKNYKIELYMTYKAVFQLVRISLSVVDYLVDERVRRTNFNITRVTVSPYRNCKLILHSHVSPWFVNSTRFDYWYSCESIDEKSFEKELTKKSDLVTIETEGSDVLDLDLATYILTQHYTNGGNPKEPICGLPEVPTGLDMHVINHHSRYAFKCAPGFAPSMASDVTDFAKYKLECARDMKWTGSLPNCLPQKMCKPFELREYSLTEVFFYENVYYYNTSHWFAVQGTRAHFRCKDETQLFIGKEYRVCSSDGKWSDSLPHCLDPEKESKLTVSMISIIALLAVILVFSLTAVLVFCCLRIRKTHSNKQKAYALRQSNAYDDYDFNGMGMDGKNIDENYENVDDIRYESNSQMQRNMTPLYTPMIGQSYRYNYNDKNVYDDCYDSGRAQNPKEMPFDDSYIVMKVY